MSKELSRVEGVSMCQGIIAEINHASTEDSFGLCAFLHPMLDTVQSQVGQSTRLLLANRSFMGIAADTDGRIRPVLVAGAMVHAPPRDAYLFLDEESDNTTQVIMEAFRIFVDPNILRSAEGLRITLMQK
ncbi:unnamed protein product, partial [Pylaiella littoralis]